MRKILILLIFLAMIVRLGTDVNSSLAQASGAYSVVGRWKRLEPLMGYPRNWSARRLLLLPHSGKIFQTQKENWFSPDGIDAAVGDDTVQYKNCDLQDDLLALQKTDGCGVNQLDYSRAWSLKW